MIDHVFPNALDDLFLDEFLDLDGLFVILDARTDDGTDTIGKVALL